MLSTALGCRLCWVLGFRVGFVEFEGFACEFPLADDDSSAGDPVD